MKMATVILGVMLNTRLVKISENNLIKIFNAFSNRTYDSIFHEFGMQLLNIK